MRFIEFLNGLLAYMAVTLTIIFYLEFNEIMYYFSNENMEVKSEMNFLL